MNNYTTIKYLKNISNNNDENDVKINFLTKSLHDSTFNFVKYNAR